MELFNVGFHSEMRDFSQGQGRGRFYTGGILEVCRGLKFESDTEIGQKGMLVKVLSMRP